MCDIEERDISTPPPCKKLKKSQCTPLFMNAYTIRGERIHIHAQVLNSSDCFKASLGSLFHAGAQAVIHTHSKAAVMTTLLFPGKEFRITHQEMIKGIRKGNSGSNFRLGFSIYLIICFVIMFI